MRRVRIKGRFFVFLALVALIAFFIVRPYLSFGERTEVIMMASSNYTKTMDAVIVRDESLVTAESVARIEYIAAEDTLVEEGDDVAYLYSTGYSESELEKLETIRENIQAYHKTMLANIIDPNLERLDLAVNQWALQYKSLVTGKTTGNLITVARQLESAMVARQEYMRSNMRNDLKLNNLYAQENTRLNSIASWRVESTAEKSGVVSFYTDGYESFLNEDTIASLSAAQVKKVLAGEELGDSSSRVKSVYRLVNQSTWYVAILTDGKTWNPIVDQEYSMQFEGFEDLTFSAKVTTVSQSEGSVLAVFRIDAPIGPLIYQRKARASVSITFNGLSVPAKAIYEQNGQTGVWLYDVPGGTFVPVTVLSSDGSAALIEPQVDGAISIGQRVLIK
jgi:putative membrane fusion protein